MVERVSVRADAAQPLVRSDHGKEKLTTIKFEDWSERCSLGVLLIVGGVLKIISGIAAIGNSDFFVHNTQYVFASLKELGLDHADPRESWRSSRRVDVRRW